MIYQLPNPIDVVRKSSKPGFICKVCGIEFFKKSRSANPMCSIKCVVERNRVLADERCLKYKGMVFNSIKVADVFINYMPVNGKMIRVIYCDFICHCGKLFKSKLGHVKCGYTKSCGCINRKRLKEKNPRMLPAGESCFNLLYNSYKGSAKKRDYEFSLTKEEFRHIVKSPCYFCGRVDTQKVLKGVRAGTHGTLNGNFSYTGIDRLENTSGYTIENSVSCCWQCNRAKGPHSKQEFLDTVKLIYEKHIKNA